jgi:glycosyltransferase involved in cell wall biosynthesis
MVFVAQSPTPYYTAVLNALADRIDLTVIYMDAHRPPSRARSSWAQFNDPWGTDPRFRRMFHRSLSLDVPPVDFHAQVSIGVSRRLRQMRPDVLMVHGWGPAMVEPVVWSRAAKVPLVIWTESTRISGLMRDRLSQLLRRAVIRQADALVSVGSLATAFATELGAPRDAIVTSCLPSPTTAAITERPMQHRDRPTVEFLFVGRLVPLKRPLDVIRTFADVLGGESAVRLTIAGDGPLRPEVEAAALALGADRVRVLGRAEGADLVDLYLESDVLVVPSEREVWGLVVNEGLAAGLFVVASDRVASAVDLLDPVSGTIFGLEEPGALGRAMVRAVRVDKSLAAREHRRGRIRGCSDDALAAAIVAAAGLATARRQGRRPGRGLSH